MNHQKLAEHQSLQRTWERLADQLQAKEDELRHRERAPKIPKGDRGITRLRAEVRDLESRLTVLENHLHRYH